ncbi:AcrR family transcriptional regulator [Leucobacter exalbidus]|uniref:AcrR family transcriptional regulator n=1 Tax=Leucobacter exalbidus TaxID=662960 RepID=A0A940PRP8_9MICO|nr:TetR family transcriptional regulator [Leucobacter exalbidus]MBP1326314.1 AcrR family transcriptional regulator [Leucobacter exalbidus]
MGDSSKRVRLDQRVIVDGVLELSRTEPTSRITFKRLGAALGVDATAMYRHFRNKDELTRAALDRLIGAAAEAGREAPGNWRSRIETFLFRLAELSLEHPSIASEGAVIDAAGIGDIAADELILEQLTEAGLAGDALIRAYAAISGFSLSQGAALAQEAMTVEGAARDGSIPWIGSYGVTNLAEYPHVYAHRDALFAISGMDVYRAGVAAILDATERAADGS